MVVYCCQTTVERSSEICDSSHLTCPVLRNSQRYENIVSIRHVMKMCWHTTTASEFGTVEVKRTVAVGPLSGHLTQVPVEALGLYSTI